MARGLVVPTQDRTKDRIEKAFAGSSLVTNADIAAMRANGLATVKDFAKAASDGDLTDKGFTPESSIRLIGVFEKSAYADLLDYEVPQTVPLVRTVQAPPPAPSKGFWQGLLGR